MSNVIDLLPRIRKANGMPDKWHSIDDHGHVRLTDWPREIVSPDDLAQAAGLTDDEPPEPPQAA